MVEDSKDGLVLCKLIKEIYFKDRRDINIDTFHGVLNLVNTIKDMLKVIIKNDVLVIIYDNIIENELINDVLLDVDELITELNIHNIQFISTISFELEVLLIDDIEYFMNDQYNKYVMRLKKLYTSNSSTRELTTFTKNNEIYKGMYDKIKKRKKGRGPYKGMTDDELDNCITVESLSKLLLNLVFSNRAINKPMTDCWIHKCCSHTRCDSKSEIKIDIDKIIDMQSIDEYVKANMIISNTSYKKLVDVLGGKLKYKYNIRDFIKKDIAAEYIRDLILQRKDSKGGN